MADVADQAGNLIDDTEAANIARIRKSASDIPIGAAGECEVCETYYDRIVNGICCRCRDEFKL